MTITLEFSLLKVARKCYTTLSMINDIFQILLSLEDFSTQNFIATIDLYAIFNPLNFSSQLYPIFKKCSCR